MSFSLGVIVSARGNTVDIVSRTFYPRKFHSEDAVTGSSHCLLIPYWAKQLNKNKLHSYQLSKRGGELICEFAEERVYISGLAILYLQGTIHV